jgi:cobalt-zinc-cadmium resistance protein CzcA
MKKINRKEKINTRLRYQWAMGKDFDGYWHVARVNSFVDNWQRARASIAIINWLENCKISIANCKLQIANCLLPLAHCLLQIANCKFPITHCLLPIAHCKFPIAHFKFPIAHCLLPIAYCFLLITPISYSQTITIDKVEDAINIALQNNLEIKSNDLKINASKSLIKTAYELPKLDINAQLGQYNSIKFDNAFQFSQTIPFPALFKAKKDLLQAEILAVQIQKDISIYELKNQVRTLYDQIEYLHFKKEKLLTLDSLYLEFIRVAKLRYKTGDTKKIEISTAETKKGEINLHTQQNEVYLQNAYKSLQALLNTKEDIKIIHSKIYEPLKITTLIDSSAITHHPYLQSLYQNRVIAEQTKKVEMAQNMPDFTIGYNNQSLIGFQTVDGVDRYFGAGKRFHAVNIGVAIPLTSGAKKARIESLDYQKQSFEALAKQESVLLNTQLQNAIAQYQQNVQQYYYYQSQALPNATEIVKTAQFGYDTGDISYVEYLYALQTATDVQMNYLESIQQINQSVANINLIINK